MRVISRGGVFVGFCSWTILTSLVLQYVLPIAAHAKQEITVTAGTVVSLRTVEDLHPRSLHVGDRVVLKVVSDVLVDGKVVIAAGASARGEITVANQRGMAGVNAKIGLSVKSVQAVDGTTVALLGTKLAEGQSKTTQSVIFTILCCILFLLQKGEDASIPSGTLIDTEVAGTVKLIIE